MAASLIGAPMPSTTGTPSSCISQSGLMCTGHWVMPIGRITSAPSLTSSRALSTNAAHHLVTVGDDIWQLEPAGAPADHLVDHVEALDHAVAERNDEVVIHDDAEAAAKHRGDVQHRLARTDHRDIDHAAAGIDAEIERPKRHHRIVALPLGLAKCIEERRHRDAQKVGGVAEKIRRRLHRYDPDLDLGGGIGERRILAPLALLGRILADHEGDPDLAACRCVPHLSLPCTYGLIVSWLCSPGLNLPSTKSRTPESFQPTRCRFCSSSSLALV